MSGRQTDRGGLSPSARSLLQAARDADGPKPEDRERVRRALAVALAASAGTAGMTASATGNAKTIASATASTATAGATATSVASVATASVLTKVAIAVVALGVGSGAIVAVNHYASAPQASSQLEASAHASVVDRSMDREAAPIVRGEPVFVIPNEIETPIEVAPIVAPEVVAPEEAPPEVTTAPTTPTHRLSGARSQAAHATTDDDVSTLDAENALLRDALHAATPERRLASVDEHAARFPNGQLAGARDDRRRVAVRELCAEGPEAVASYLAAHPQSSSAPLLRTTCGSSH